MSQSQPGGNGFAAGPPQGETSPLGGQRSTRSGERGGNIVFFDLDHTLLSGDSDVLWCDFLIAQGLLDAADFGAQNTDMDARYRAGTVGLDEFANFYVGTLAGRSPQVWDPLRQRFLHEEIVPRIPPSALALVQQHQAAGDLVVMTTATNRFITELTAAYIGIEYLIAPDGRRVFYDINANSNLRPAIAQSYGFDPFERVVSFLVAQLEAQRARRAAPHER